MVLTVIASATAAVLAVIAYLVVALHPAPTPDWRVPAAIGIAFTGWTIYSIVDDGPFGFLRQHVAAPWESQITMDLLIMATVAWVLLQPRLRAAGIRPLPWVPLILATGSIGMLLLVVRLARAESGAESTGARRSDGSGRLVQG